MQLSLYVGEVFSSYSFSSSSASYHYRFLLIFFFFFFLCAVGPQMVRCMAF